jgi:hypothetical protein
MRSWTTRRSPVYGPPRSARRPAAPGAAVHPARGDHELVDPPAGLTLFDQVEQGLLGRVDQQAEPRGVLPWAAASVSRAGLTGWSPVTRRHRPPLASSFARMNASSAELAQPVRTAPGVLTSASESSSVVRGAEASKTSVDRARSAIRPRSGPSAASGPAARLSTGAVTGSSRSRAASSIAVCD